MFLKEYTVEYLHLSDRRGLLKRAEVKERSTCTGLSWEECAGSVIMRDSVETPEFKGTC